MVYKRLPNNMPEILRKHGLKVVEVPGWKTRGRPASIGEFAPVGVLCHYTATGKNWTDKRVVDLLVEGRSDLPGPLSQFGLGRDGTVYLVASGRCNHGGPARASGSVAGGDGNKLYIGIEAFNAGGDDPWPKVQYDAYVLLCAILSLEVTKNSAQTVRGHRETSKTGKPDPQFSMAKFRSQVAEKMVALVSPTTPPEEPDPEEPEESETISSGFGLWKWYSGKRTSKQVVKPGSGDHTWTRIDLKKEPASGIKSESSEHRLLYLRIELPNGRTADRVVETKFIRANGDDTAYDSEEYGLTKDSIPYYNNHFEDGDGAGGSWWIRVTGGKDPIVLTTRYAKQHTFFEDNRMMLL